MATTVTQKFMGKGQLIDRLAAQVGNRDTAISILQKRGHLESDGKTLTTAGQARDQMTAGERAKDRAHKSTGTPMHKLVYNPRTNQAKRR